MRILRALFTASAVATGFFGAMAAHRVIHAPVAPWPCRAMPPAKRDPAALCAEAVREAALDWLGERMRIVAQADERLSALPHR